MDVLFNLAANLRQNPVLSSLQDAAGETEGGLFLEQLESQSIYSCNKEQERNKLPLIQRFLLGSRHFDRERDGHLDLFSWLLRAFTIEKKSIHTSIDLDEGLWWERIRELLNSETFLHTSISTLFPLKDGHGYSEELKRLVNLIKFRPFYSCTLNELLDGEWRNDPLDWSEDHMRIFLAPIQQYAHYFSRSVHEVVAEIEGTLRCVVPYRNEANFRKSNAYFFQFKKKMEALDFLYQIRLKRIVHLFHQLEKGGTGALACSRELGALISQFNSAYRDISTKLIEENEERLFALSLDPEATQVIDKDLMGQSLHWRELDPNRGQFSLFLQSIKNCDPAMEEVFASGEVDLLVEQANLLDQKLFQVNQDKKAAALKCLKNGIAQERFLRYNETFYRSYKKLQILIEGYRDMCFYLQVVQRANRSLIRQKEQDQMIEFKPVHEWIELFDDHHVEEEYVTQTKGVKKRSRTEPENESSKESDEGEFSSSVSNEEQITPLSFYQECIERIDLSLKEERTRPELVSFTIQQLVNQRIQKRYVPGTSTFLKMRTSVAIHEVKDRVQLACNAWEVYIHAMSQGHLKEAASSLRSLILNWHVAVEQSLISFYIEKKGKAPHHHHLVDLAKQAEVWDDLEKEQQDFLELLDYGLIWARYPIASMQRYPNESSIPSALKWIAFADQEIGPTKNRTDSQKWMECSQFVLQLQKSGVSWLSGDLFTVEAECKELCKKIHSGIDSISVNYKNSQGQMQPPKSLKRVLGKLNERSSIHRSEVDAHIRRLWTISKMTLPHHLQAWQEAELFHVQWPIEETYQDLLLQQQFGFIQMHNFEELENLLASGRQLDPENSTSTIYDRRLTQYNFGKAAHYPRLALKLQGSFEATRVHIQHLEECRQSLQALIEFGSNENQFEPIESEVNLPNACQAIERLLSRY